MAAAALVVAGTVPTVDDARPTAKARGADGAYLDGWDPLPQNGLRATFFAGSPR
ncbi:hypothetical protein [Mycobacterium alsense]|uniref:hypothetical protein n=1 Tax=Mycobacterium alsense TaxID=324058 RepID=UPI000AC94709|nr:hypothetical protein [Mycobacterium alsense]